MHFSFLDFKTFITFLNLFYTGDLLGKSSGQGLVDFNFDLGSSLLLL